MYLPNANLVTCASAGGLGRLLAVKLSLEPLDLTIDKTVQAVGAEIALLRRYAIRTRRKHERQF